MSTTKTPPVTNMLEVVNELIRTGKDYDPSHDNYVNPKLVSDGYHTFGELYEHRVTLFIALALSIQVSDGHSFQNEVWKSKKHHDGSSYDGCFIMGIGKEKGKQISYHLPLSKWDNCEFVKELETAPEWDGHTSDDVIKRIAQL